MYLWPLSVSGQSDLHVRVFNRASGDCRPLHLSLSLLCCLEGCKGLAHAEAWFQLKDCVAVLALQSSWRELVSSALIQQCLWCLW